MNSWSSGKETGHSKRFPIVNLFGGTPCRQCPGAPSLKLDQPEKGWLSTPTHISFIFLFWIIAINKNLGKKFQVALRMLVCARPCFRNPGLYSSLCLGFKFLDQTISSSIKLGTKAKIQFNSKNSVPFCWFQNIAVTNLRFFLLVLYQLRNFLRLLLADPFSSSFPSINPSTRQSIGSILGPNCNLIASHLIHSICSEDI